MSSMDLTLGLGLILINDWLLLFIVLGVAYYVYMTWPFDFFQKRGINGPKPYPIIGTLGPVFTTGFWDNEFKLYKTYGKVFGTFEGRQPVLVVGEEEMLKEILVKEFNSFANRRKINIGNEINDNFITVLDDDDWKRVRNLITPTFTSGKLKFMSKRIQQCAKLLIENVENKCEKDGMFEAKELTSGFTMDVIARTAFGLEVDSQKDPDNEFVKMGNKAFKFSLFNPLFIIIMFFPFMLPVLAKLKVNLMPKGVIEFFKSVVEKTLQNRKEGDNTQVDFIQLMANAHNEDFDETTTAEEAKEGGGTFDASQLKQKKGLSRIEILAQGIIFFLAGFETTATTIAFLLYNLAINQDIQEKLYDEIEEKLGDKDMDYNTINSMQYLDQCFNESMRLYPPAFRFDRRCGRDITIKGLHIPKDTVINVPVLGIHYDPEIYPDPEKFDPERFTPEAKAARSPFHYMPFGYGPRNCIGMRLAIIEAKMATVQILRKLKVVPCEKTEIPIKIAKVGLVKAENGIWMSCEKRSEK